MRIGDYRVIVRRVADQEKGRPGTGFLVARVVDRKELGRVVRDL